MTQYDDIITSILKREGAFVDDPDDPGGITNYGITVKSLSEHRGHPATADDIRRLTPSDARAFYYEMYIVKPGFDKLPMVIAPIVIDCGVNNGRERATKWLQQAVGVVPDGKLGPRTLAALNGVVTKNVVHSIIRIRMDAYVDLALANSKLMKFLKGWTRRALEFMP